MRTKEVFFIASPGGAERSEWNNSKFMAPTQRQERKEKEHYIREEEKQGVRRIGLEETLRGVLSRLRRREGKEGVCSEFFFQQKKERGLETTLGALAAVRGTQKVNGPSKNAGHGDRSWGRKKKGRIHTCVSGEKNEKEKQKRAQREETIGK